MKSRMKAVIIGVLVLSLTAIPFGGYFGYVSYGAEAAVIEMPTAEEIVGMSRYDGREYGIITPVRDQGSTNLCWAYSTVAASEVSLLKSGVVSSFENVSLDPVAAAYRVYKRESDPLGNTNGEWSSVNYLTATGSPAKLARLFSMWWGPVKSGNTGQDPFADPVCRFENAFYIPENKDDPVQRIADIKEAVARYGAVTFQYNNLREVEYYNPKNETGSNSSPHACTVIGWDDNISADSFVPNGASQNGGWLVKNSYSSLEYFWLSYDNTSSTVFAFTYAEADKYDYNYYYDGGLEDFSLRRDKTVANVFKAKKGTSANGEFISAVNVGVEGEDVTLEIEIFKGLDSPYGGQSNVPTAGKSQGKTAVTLEHGGFVTVELDRAVRVEKDEWFSVIARVSNAGGDCKIITAYKDAMDLSYSGSGDNWSKLGNFVGRVKAFTSVKLLGDVDLNGKVTSLDVLLLRRILSGQGTAADVGTADYDGDGRITARDIMAIRRVMAASSQ